MILTYVVTLYHNIIKIKGRMIKEEKERGYRDVLTVAVLILTTKRLETYIKLI